ncbi:SGNH/GDSL hydrolase family protein [Haloarcula marina]|uniref:SGNH/GDSL hydrolase family protein n=1 Tax=Haloarcula marina TaxID=2961574 RepID=UPI0020B82F41|nr:SGNH/GDSL hydrolase family protein [Halomicroarcula marina]
MIHDDIAFHNVAELREVPTGGHMLQRVPESVRKHLNSGAQERMQIPSAAELRFVTDDEVVSLTLSCPEGPTTAIPFWGNFQGLEPVEIGPNPEPIEIAYPDRIAELDPGIFEDHHFSPRVWRLQFDHDAPGPVHYHGVKGDVNPPEEQDLPEQRLLTYGTSITEGFRASKDHLSYAAQTAQRLGVDLMNLGSGGSALCETEIADHIASLEWDVATLSLSVNMLTQGVSLETFRERARYMLETIAEKHPDDLVIAITLFPLSADFDGSSMNEGWQATPTEYREALRGVVDNAAYENLHLVEGPDLLTDIGGHTSDIVHPADNGMIQIGERLAAEIEQLLQ